MQDFKEKKLNQMINIITNIKFIKIPEEIKINDILFKIYKKK